MIMQRNPVSGPARGALLFLAALAAPSCASSAQEADVVAQAADRHWTIEEAAQLLAPHAQLPADPEVVRALSNLWIDYTLLATAASEDPELRHIDVSMLVDELVSERILRMLRDTVITVDTPTAAELRRRYDQEAPGSLVRARHIVLAWPEDDRRRDSVRTAAATLRQRITEGGEDFATLARELSQDPGSAARGGDLGVLGLGQYFPTLEATGLALEPGEVSQPVESPWGVHLIQADSRQTPDRDVFRNHLMRQLAVQAESTYVAGLEETFRPSPVDGAAATVRALAQDPRISLSARDERTPLYRYQGGSVTQGAALRELQRMPPEARQQIAFSRDDEVPLHFLRGMVHKELLLIDARRRGYAIRPEVRQGLVDAAHANLAQTLRQLGLEPTHDGPSVSERVDALLTGVLSGERREVTPLGVMSHVLREQYSWAIHEPQLAGVARRIQELRTAATSPSTPY
jgi:peptidyl-prolyl cis-trans isomerase C